LSSSSRFDEPFPRPRRTTDVPNPTTAAHTTALKIVVITDDDDDEEEEERADG
jgi:hypothetical protein